MLARYLTPYMSGSLVFVTRLPRTPQCPFKPDLSTGSGVADAVVNCQLPHPYQYVPQNPLVRVFPYRPLHGNFRHFIVRTLDPSRRTKGFPSDSWLKKASSGRCLFLLPKGHTCDVNISITPQPGGLSDDAPCFQVGPELLRRLKLYRWKFQGFCATHVLDVIVDEERLARIYRIPFE